MGLAAGLGTRLRPLTEVRAKPALPVAGEPIIRRILRWLAANGVVDVTLNLHHLPETVTAVVGDGGDLGAAVRYSWEQPTILGSAGGPRQALDILGVENFFGQRRYAHRPRFASARGIAHPFWGTRDACAGSQRRSATLGGVELAEDGGVLGFVPRGPAAARSFHFIGVQLVHRSVFSGLPPARAANSIGGCYDALIAREPGAIRGFVTNARFWDIGTVADYWQTSWSWTTETNNVAPASHISKSATINRSIVWNEVEIGARSVLEECIVTDGVHMAAGTQYQRKILIRAADGTTTVVPLEID